MRKKTVALSIVVIIILIILGIFWWYYENASDKDELHVKETVEVKQMTLNSVISATGTIRPLHSVEVSSKITARIKEVFVKENDIVKKGDIVAVLDGKDYQAKAQEASYHVANMKAKYDRISYLYSIGANTKAEYEDALYNYETAQTRLQMATSDLAEITIKAPIDGEVIGEPITEGSMAVQGIGNSTVIMHIADLSTKQIKAKIDETDIGKVKIGQEAVFTVDAYPNKKFSAKVVDISKTDVTNSWNANNSNISVIYYYTLLDIYDPAKLLLPAMTARVDITTAKKENALALPLVALKSKEGKMYVLKVEKDGAVVETPVEVGIYSDEYVEILSGLAVGDKVSIDYNIDAEKEKSKDGRKKRLIR